MPKDSEAPPMTMKANVRRFKLRSPMLDLNEDVTNDGKQPSLPQMEARL